MTFPPADPLGSSNPFETLALAIVQAFGAVLVAVPSSGAARGEVLRQTAMQKIRPTLVPVGELLELQRRGVVTDQEWVNSLARYGFTDRAIEALGELRKTLLDAPTIIELLRREDLDEAEAVARLSDLGYTETSSLMLRRLTETLPPLQDVLRWAVREVFTPEIRQRFQLDEDFPADVLPFARRLGFSDENTRNEWASHWVLPSLTAGYEMLHRAPETGITEQDLDLLLRAQDVMPFWREPLKAIAFRPWTRVDVRRMHKLGVLDDAALVRAYLDLGFDQTRAEGLADFTVRLNSDEADAGAEPFRASLRSRAQSLFLAGVIGEQELGTILADLGHTADQVAAFVAESAFVLEAESAQDVRQAVRGLFVRGFWTEEQAMARLLDLGFDQAEIRRLFGTWELERELREETAAEASQRDLSKTDVLGAFRDALIDRQEAAEFLDLLGFDRAEQEVLLDRETLKRATEVRARVERTQRSLFLAGRRTPSDVRSRLGEAGIPAERIEALIADWEAEREARTPELTTAQIQRAFARKLLPREQAAARLDEAGYSIEDRDILLDLAQNPQDVEEGA
ncbi:MAG: hypothetical protein O2816_05050 [Planctomycetota bacterium]|nr:hypothetical protein [Planctomycetota bacterium]